MKFRDMSPTELAAHLPAAEHYQRARSRMDALHADPDADPHEMLEAEQQAVYARQELDAETPWADSPEDVTTRAVNLDGDGVAYVEHIEGRVELTVKMRGRLNVALILSPAEAGEIGQALARPHGPTTGDLFAVADAMRADPAELAKQWGTASTGDACGCPDDRCAGYHHDADLDRCPCAESLAKDSAL